MLTTVLLIIVKNRKHLTCSTVLFWAPINELIIQCLAPAPVLLHLENRRKYNLPFRIVEKTKDRHGACLALSWCFVVIQLLSHI